MTYNQTVYMIQQKYKVSEHDAIQILAMQKYKQALKMTEVGANKCTIDVKI